MEKDLSAPEKHHHREQERDDDPRGLDGEEVGVLLPAVCPRPAPVADGEEDDQGANQRTEEDAHRAQVDEHGVDIGRVVQPIQAGQHAHVHNIKTKRW